MRVCILPVVCLGIFLQGCSSFRKPETPVSLDESDTRFADSLAHFSQALVYSMETGRFSENALSEFITAAELDPGPGRNEIFPFIAHHCLSSRDNSESIAKVERLCIDHYKQAIKSQPSYSANYDILARLYFKQAQDKQAINCIQKGIQNSDIKNSLRAMARDYGKAFVMNKEYLRAASCFEVILDKNNENYRRSNFILAELYEVLNSSKKAEEHYQIAAEGTNALPEAFIKLSYLCMDESPEKSIRILADGLRKFPDEPRILFCMGYAHGQLKHYNEAIDIYEKMPAIIQQSEDMKLTPEYYLAYGATCEQSGKHDKAEKVFEEGLKSYPKQHQILNYLAYMWAEHNMKLDRALDYIDQALKIEPDNGAYIDTLGWIYYRQDKYEAAIKEIEKANDLISDDPTIKDHLGDVYDKISNKDKAIAFWTESFLLDPGNNAVAEKLKLSGINIRKLKKDAGKLKSRTESDVSGSAEPVKQ